MSSIYVVKLYYIDWFPELAQMTEYNDDLGGEPSLIVKETLKFNERAPSPPSGGLPFADDAYDMQVCQPFIF